MSDQRNFMDTGPNPYRPPSSEVAPTAPVSPETSSGSEELADRWVRLGAHMIDQAIAFAAAIPGIATTGAFIFMGTSRGDAPNFEEGGLVIGIVLLVLAVLAVVGFQAYLVSTTGQSLGKRWLKIKIIRMDGSPCGFVYGVLLRAWLMAFAQSMLSALGSILSLVDTCMIFREDRRCLHDHIAGTQVIVARTTPEIPRPF